MVKLLANLGYLVARRCFRSFGDSSVAFALERTFHATKVEPEASARSFRAPVVAHRTGRNRVRRMVSNFCAELSDLVYLRSDRHLDRVSIYAA